MHAGMVAFDTESWPRPSAGGRVGRVGEESIDVPRVLSSILYMYEQVSQGRRRVRRRGKRCLSTRQASKLERGGGESSRAKTTQVSDCLTHHTHATPYRKHNPPLQGQTYPSHATNKRRINDMLKTPAIGGLSCRRRWRLLCTNEKWEEVQQHNTMAVEEASSRNCQMEVATFAS